MLLEVAIVHKRLPYNHRRQDKRIEILAVLRIRCHSHWLSHNQVHILLLLLLAIG